MEVFETITAFREWLEIQKSQNQKIHFVPTMGYFHEGHLSLMRAAKADNTKLVISLFVNPKQFGPREDYNVYPRDLARDYALAESIGVDAVFAPSPDEMYPKGFETAVAVPKLAKPLCGKSRPRHFNGVALVVLKLFNIIQPDKAYFGMKDYQQLQIIKKMVDDLNLRIEVVSCPIVREQDGLAMSSRNVRLSDADRQEAPIIQMSMQKAYIMVKAGEVSSSKIIRLVKQSIKTSRSAVIDYVNVTTLDTLEPIKKINGPCLLAAAVKFGNVRLIDNIILEP